jgi:hypothetical protein
MILFFAANIIVGLSAFILAKRLSRGFSAADNFLVFCTVFMAQVILSALILGVAGRLYFGNLILLNLLILLAAYFICRPKRGDFIIRLTGLSFIFENKFLIAPLCIFAVFFIVKTWINLVNPPICPDSLQYHLSFPAKWLIYGNLVNPLVIFGSQPTSAELTALMYYPINAELIFFWLLAPLRNAFLADLGEAPFYILGIVAIYSILRKFSVRRDIAFFSGMLWALIPNLFKQMRFGSQIDVICAALILLALNFMVVSRDKFDFKAGTFLGICCGILIGTKLTNIFWLFALVPFFIWIVYNQRKLLGNRQIFASLGLLIISCLLFGGFSYLRTFILTGNPFYPVSLKFLGREIFPGFIDKDTFSNLFVNWSEFSLVDFLFGEGLGVQLFVYVLAGTFLPVALFYYTRNKFKDPAGMFTFFCAPLIMLFMYFFAIKAFWPRYLFPYLGVGLICMVIFVMQFKWGRLYMGLTGTVCVIASMVELARRQELIISLVATVIAAVLIFVFRKTILKVLSGSLRITPVLLVTLVLFLVLSYLNNKYDREEFSRYPGLFIKAEIGQRDIGFAWEWLNAHTGAGARIAYTGRSEFYPLFGSRLKNDVFYISINNKPALPHLYSDGLYRKDKDFSAWKKNLRDARINILFIGLPHAINNESADASRFPIEDEWADNDKEEFRLIFSNSKARIYALSFKDKLDKVKP